METCLMEHQFALLDGVFIKTKFFDNGDAKALGEMDGIYINQEIIAFLDRGAMCMHLGSACIYPEALRRLIPDLINKSEKTKCFKLSHKGQNDSESLFLEIFFEDMVLPQRLVLNAFGNRITLDMYISAFTVESATKFANELEEMFTKAFSKAVSGNIPENIPIVS